MNKVVFKQILKYIKKYETIVIGRHVGADPDCLSSQIALRDSLKIKFPNKKIYAVGTPASRFKFLGKLDRVPNDINYNESLAIILDTPDRRRIDTVEVEKYDFSIKIDHHPFIVKTCDLELIDPKASSTAQMLMEFILEFNLPLTDEIADKLYAGLVSDTNRFMFDYTSSYTFELTAELFKRANVNINQIYRHLYMRPLNELRFLGYLKQNMEVTENGLGHIKIDNKILNKFKVDPATAGNMINDFNFISEMYSWVIFSEEEKNKIIRVLLRSRGPIINDVLEKYNGGGHHYAAGARIKTFEEADEIIKALDERCKKYKESE